MQARTSSEREKRLTAETLDQHVTSMEKPGIVNVFSVDVEDYFHPSELGGNISRWSLYQSRVNVGLEFLLEALAAHEVRATFFILGWVATHYPRLIRRIAEQGHEIGCHSYSHRLVYRLSPAEFQEDTRWAVQAIGDATGVVPRIYRAPSYSITRSSLWALDILASSGFTHDSSIYPIVHDRYGIPGFSRHACSIHTASGIITEVPIATVRLGQEHVAPVGGGAYMRLFPYRYTAAGIRRINRSEQAPACLYLHPWELDPDQPRLASNLVSHLRTYTGLRGMRRKTMQLLGEFQFGNLVAVHPTPLGLPAFTSLRSTERGRTSAATGGTGSQVGLYSESLVSLEPSA
jgi:polysaccharide deacetylase family protein (PEP-CTERM system associated)